MKAKWLSVLTGLMVGAGAWADGGHRVNLWPVLYMRDGTVHLLGPVVKVAENDVAVRPLFAVNTEQERRVRILYPLSEFNAGNKGSWVFPLFWGEDHRVAFPFYWRFDEPYAETGSGYHGIPPFYSYYRKGDRYSLYAPWPFVRVSDWGDKKVRRAWPIYGEYETVRRTGGYGMWPVSGWWQDKGAPHASGRYVFPMFYHESSEEASRFLSIAWSQGYARTDDRTWRAAVPFFYHETRDDGSSLVTLPFVRVRKGDTERWLVPPVATWGERGPDTNSWYALAGVAGRTRATDLQRDHILPFYYRHRTPDRSLFATPLGGWITQAHGRRRWDVYPLLTWLDRRPNETNFWALAPLIRYSQTTNGVKHHVLPFYIKDGTAGRFVSPVYASWKDGDRTVKVVPPLLSAVAREGGRSDVWVGAGLYHRQTGVPREERKGHWIPFYYYEGTRKLYTPLYGYEKDVPEAMNYYAGGLAGRYTGDHEGHWVWPLYRTKVHRETGHYDDHYLIAGRRWTNAHGHGSGFWPVYRYAHTAQRQAHVSSPLVKMERTTRNILLVAQHDTTTWARRAAGGITVESNEVRRLTPVWRRERTERADAGEMRTATSALLGVYRSQSFENSSFESVRRRLLWKAWDYRRTDDRVEVDIFPFITYDRSPDGGHETSFLWRFFRYGKDTTGRASLDILFVPLLR